MKFTPLLSIFWIAVTASAQAPAFTVERVTNVMDRYPQLSPDGSTLVFDSNRTGISQIFTVKPNVNAVSPKPRSPNTGPRYSSDTVQQITHLPFQARCPCWSPDMKKIAFAGEPNGASEIFVMDADGSHVVQLTRTGGDDSHPHWSADGSRIMFNSSRTTPDPKADWAKQ
jgi:TolB protein